MDAFINTILGLDASKFKTGSDVASQSLAKFITELQKTNAAGLDFGKNLNLIFGNTKKLINSGSADMKQLAATFNDSWKRIEISYAKVNRTIREGNAKNISDLRSQLAIEVSEREKILAKLREEATLLRQRRALEFRAMRGTYPARRAGMVDAGTYNTAKYKWLTDQVQHYKTELLQLGISAETVEAEIAALTNQVHQLNTAFASTSSRDKINKLKQDYNRLRNELQAGTVTNKQFNTAVTGLNQKLPKTAAHFRLIKDRVNEAGAALQRTAVAFLVLSKMSQAYNATLEGFKKFETAMVKIDVITEDHVNNIGNLTAAINDMAEVIPMATTDMVEGLEVVFQALEATDAQALGVTETASKLATIGFGKVDTTANMLVATLNAGVRTMGGAEVQFEDLDHVADVLFNTIRAGVVTFDELSARYGKVSQAARLAGDSIEELGALIIGATRSGGSAATNLTQLERMMTELRRPKAQATLEKFGIDPTGKTIEILREFKNLYGDILDKSGEVREGVQKRIFELIPNIRAQKGFMILLNNLEQVEKFTLQNISLLNTVNDEIDVVSKTFEGNIQLMKNSFQELSQVIGKDIIPSLITYNSILKTLATSMNNMDPSTRKATESLLAFLAAFTALNVVAALSGQSVGALFLALAAPGWATIGIVAAMGAAIFGITRLITAMDEAAQTSDKFYKAIDENIKIRRANLGLLENELGYYKRLNGFVDSRISAIEDENDVIKDQEQYISDINTVLNTFYERLGQSYENADTLTIALNNLSTAQATLKTKINETNQELANQQLLLQFAEYTRTSGEYLAEYGNTLKYKAYDTNKLPRDAAGNVLYGQGYENYPYEERTLLPGLYGQVGDVYFSAITTAANISKTPEEAAQNLEAILSSKRFDELVKQSGVGFRDLGSLNLPGGVDINKALALIVEHNQKLKEGERVGLLAKGTQRFNFLSGRDTMSLDNILKTGDLPDEDYDAGSKKRDPYLVAKEKLEDALKEIQVNEQTGMYIAEPKGRGKDLRKAYDTFLKDVLKSDTFGRLRSDKGLYATTMQHQRVARMGYTVEAMKSRGELFLEAREGMADYDYDKKSYDGLKSHMANLLKQKRALLSDFASLRYVFNFKDFLDAIEGTSENFTQAQVRLSKILQKRLKEGKEIQISDLALLTTEQRDDINKEWLKQQLTEEQSSLKARRAILEERQKRPEDALPSRDFKIMLKSMDIALKEIEYQLKANVETDTTAEELKLIEEELVTMRKELNVLLKDINKTLINQLQISLRSFIKDEQFLGDIGESLYAGNFQKAGRDIVAGIGGQTRRWSRDVYNNMLDDSGNIKPEAQALLIAEGLVPDTKSANIGSTIGAGIGALTGTGPLGIAIGSTLGGAIGALFGKKKPTPDGTKQDPLNVFMTNVDDIVKAFILPDTFYASGRGVGPHSVHGTINNNFYGAQGASSGDVERISQKTLNQLQLQIDGGL